MQLIPGSSNGFIEKAALFIIAMVTAMGATMSDSGWLSLWCVLLGLATLYLAWHFDIFSFSSESWAEQHASEWSQATLGQYPADYVEGVSQIRDRFMPHHGVIWWFFRCVYLALGLSLLALAGERYFYGTNHIAGIMMKTLAYL